MADYWAGRAATLHGRPTWCAITGGRQLTRNLHQFVDVITSDLPAANTRHVSSIDPCGGGGGGGDVTGIARGVLARGANQRPLAVLADNQCTGGSFFLFFLFFCSGLSEMRKNNNKTSADVQKNAKNAKNEGKEPSKINSISRPWWQRCPSAHFCLWFLRFLLGLNLLGTNDLAFGLNSFALLIISWWKFVKRRRAVGAISTGAV